jgi:hypothetical protein
MIAKLLLENWYRVAVVAAVFALNNTHATNCISQQMDCASTVKYRNASSLYEFDGQSRSAICYTGQKYEHSVVLYSNIEYRFSFYASSIFNNNIRFKLINLSTGELVLDLPGEAAGSNTSAILEDYYDPKLRKFVHPYFEIFPEHDTNFKVIVEVGEQKPLSGSHGSVVLVDPDQKKGCVTIYLQSRKSEYQGF